MLYTYLNKESNEIQILMTQYIEISAHADGVLVLRLCMIGGIGRPPIILLFTELNEIFSVFRL